jgi:hypothetical protein
MPDPSKSKKQSRRKGGVTVYLSDDMRQRITRFVEHWQGENVGMDAPLDRDILTHLACRGLAVVEREYLPPTRPGIPPSELSDEELARLVELKGIELDDHSREAMIVALEAIL